MPKLEWDGLYGITNRFSILLSLSSNNFIKAENVTFLVNLPLNKGYCNTHLSINTFKPILSSMLKSLKKLTVSAELIIIILA